MTIVVPALPARSIVRHSLVRNIAVPCRNLAVVQCLNSAVVQLRSSAEVRLRSSVVALLRAIWVARASILLHVASAVVPMVRLQVARKASGRRCAATMTAAMTTAAHPMIEARKRVGLRVEVLKAVVQKRVAPKVIDAQKPVRRAGRKVVVQAQVQTRVVPKVVAPKVVAPKAVDPKAVAPKAEAMAQDEVKAPVAVAKVAGVPARVAMTT